MLSTESTLSNGGCGCQPPDLENLVPAICPRGCHGEDHTLLQMRKLRLRGKLTSLELPCPWSWSKPDLKAEVTGFAGQSSMGGKNKGQKGRPFPKSHSPEEDLFSRGIWRGLLDVHEQVRGPRGHRVLCISASVYYVHEGTWTGSRGQKCLGQPGIPQDIGTSP